MIHTAFAVLLAIMALTPGAFAGPPPVITNVTISTVYPSIQAALSAAANGDVIEIGAGTVVEDNIQFPIGVDFTLRGAGMDQTIIFGGAVADSTSMFDMPFTFQTPATVIEHLTLFGGINLHPAGGAIRAFEASPTFRHVAFRDCVGPNPSSGAAFVVMVESSLWFENCVFSGGSSAFDAVTLFNQSEVEFLQCLFADNAVAIALNVQNGSTATLMNCTISAINTAIGLVNDAPSFANVSNSVIVGAQTVDNGGVYTHVRCLFPGATGPNIDGSPTFVDAGAGDYRLAPGSLGIDAADADTYVAAGGGPLDLALGARSHNDPGVPDTGVGPFTFLDIGAFEFQGGDETCPADLNGDGAVNAADLAQTLGAWGVCP